MPQSVRDCIHVSNRYKFFSFGNTVEITSHARLAVF